MDAREVRRTVLLMLQYSDPKECLDFLDDIGRQISLESQKGQVGLSKQELVVIKTEALEKLGQHFQCLKDIIGLEEIEGQILSDEMLQIRKLTCLKQLEDTQVVLSQ